MSAHRDHDFIPSSYSRIIARELGLQERDLPRLLAGTDLPVDVLLAGDESRLTGRQQVQVLRNARTIAGAPELGLRIGRQLKPASHGPIGYLALSSPDLLTALQSLRDFLPLRIPFAQLDINEDGSWLRCELRITLQQDSSETRMLTECFAMALQSLVEAFLGRTLTEALFCFHFPRPAYYRAYGQYLQSMIKFEQPEDCLLIPRSLAGESNPSGDAASYAIARRLCAQMLEETPIAATAMTNRVRRFLLAQPLGSVTEADVAKSLYVSKRTLARRLNKEGTGYREVTEQLLSELAVRHLGEPGLSIESVALLLGYHDSANFRRAFRRWYGMPPADYRKQALMN
ncbi:AraC family transcriptional regulator [Seongchinamella unica]|uniref:AraC family transcriptional regulator n=1 Tax=Seongchinamella unica TaxID=2547392 RepID=A0A4R5LRY3_9GAMM|nr:AraC family transcriptional regulator [Seongchinamella unica]TDG13600.1 AraC family transcriptional regulator [Seongchinamella unica]